MWGMRGGSGVGELGAAHGGGGGVRGAAHATPALVFAGGARDDGAAEEEVSDGAGPPPAVGLWGAEGGQIKDCAGKRWGHCAGESWGATEWHMVGEGGWWGGRQKEGGKGEKRQEAAYVCQRLFPSLLPSQLCSCPGRGQGRPKLSSSSVLHPGIRG